MSPPELVVCEHADERDLPALVELDRGAYGHPWTAQQFAQALQSPGRGVLLLVAYRRLGLVVERRLVAHCAWQQAAGELEIHNLAVRAERRRDGFGRRLLRLALAWAARRGATAAFLEVRSSNRAARGLYAALGFEELQRRARYYHDPVEDALVLRRPLPAAREP